MAPPGYLWIVKGIISLAGPGELSLRALSMVAGIGLGVVGWWLTRRLFGLWPATAAAAILALSPGAVYYSNEVKPYLSDAFVAAILLLAGTSAIERELTWRRTALLAALGATAVWASYPAPFTLVGVGLALVVASAHRKGWRAASRLAVVGLAWTGSWGVVYHLARQGSTYAYMQRYWRDQFLDLSLAAPYRTATALVQALDVPGQTFRSPLDPWNAAVRITAIMLVLLALGIWALAVQRRVPALVMLLSAPLMALTAAVAHLYPMDVRLLLFLLPSLAALATGGLWFLGSRGLPWVALLMIAITLIWSLLVDLSDLARSVGARGREECAPRAGIRGQTWRHGLRVARSGVAPQFLSPHASISVARRRADSLGRLASRVGAHAPGGDGRVPGGDWLALRTPPRMARRGARVSARGLPRRPRHAPDARCNWDFSHVRRRRAGLARPSQPAVSAERSGPVTFGSR